jgi:hypothetical protein
MPLTGPIPEGHAYAVTYSRPSGSERNNTAKCVVCGQTMAAQGSIDVPNFKLVHRPEDA